MPRRSVTRLRENPDAAPAEAPVIEAEFKVVGRRSILGRLVRFALALAFAALLGALLPPILLTIQSIAASWRN